MVENIDLPFPYNILLYIGFLLAAGWMAVQRYRVVRKDEAKPSVRLSDPASELRMQLLGMSLGENTSLAEIADQLRKIADVVADDHELRRVARDGPKQLREELESMRRSLDELTHAVKRLLVYIGQAGLSGGSE